MTNSNVIISGRRTGMRELRKRAAEMEQLAKSKGVYYDWDNHKSHHVIYIETNEGKRIFEETVLSRGVEITKKIHAFYDIFENEIKKL